MILVCAKLCVLCHREKSKQASLCVDGRRVSVRTRGLNKTSKETTNKKQKKDKGGNFVDGSFFLIKNLISLVLSGSNP